MRIRTAIVVLAATITATAALGVGAAMPATAAPDTTRIVLVQDDPIIVRVSDETAGTTGYEFTFEAPVRTPAGKRVGALSGAVLTVDATLDGVTEEIRHRDLVFSLKGGQLVAKGVSRYPAAQAELEAGRPFVIAIVGGTGRYIGARGEVRTSPRADGTYRHVITLLK